MTHEMGRPPVTMDIYTLTWDGDEQGIWAKEGTERRVRIRRDKAAAAAVTFPFIDTTPFFFPFFLSFSIEYYPGGQEGDGCDDDMGGYG